MTLSIDEHGAEYIKGAAQAFLSFLDDLAARFPRDSPGVRLTDVQDFASVLHASGLVDRVGVGTHPVRAILFNKSRVSNWSLGWHQDRTIAVSRRVEVAGFGPWSVKAGITHVEPPFALLEQMRTVRIHLDNVDQDNAPLLIAPGSHKLGRIGEKEIEGAVARCGMRACSAERGDAWIYATPILHASAAALRPRERRVLQVDFSADNLPAPLTWLGV